MTRYTFSKHLFIAFGKTYMTYYICYNTSHIIYHNNMPEYGYTAFKEAYTTCYVQYS